MNKQHKVVKETEVMSTYLTSREKEILSYVLRGNSAKRIGLTLGISYRTVEQHILNIKTKLGCRTKVEIILAGLNPFSKLETTIPNVPQTR